ncbi:VanW family protein [Patescibacteria group bacterium]|nr:VanW family protein [Patescibacteria group bacterium]
MKFFSLEKKSKTVKWLIIVFAIIFLLIAIFGISSIVLAYKYQNKIYPGVMLDGLDLSGLTKTQAGNVIDGKFKQLYGNGFEFHAENQMKLIPNEENKILALHLDNMADSAFKTGRQNHWLVNYLQIPFLPIFKKNISLDYRFDKNSLKENLTQAFSLQETPVKNSAVNVKILDSKTKQVEIDFTESNTGETFNYISAVDTLERSIKNFQNIPITLIKEKSYPDITITTALAKKEKIEKLLQLPEVKFKYAEQEWPIKWEDFTHWISLGEDEFGNIAVLLDEQIVKGQLEAIAQSVDQPVIDAKFQIKDNKVIEFESHKNGQAADIDATYKKTIDEIVNKFNTEIELIVSETEPEIKTEKVNDLGIKEQIGIGISDFSGSPANRRHNIGVGAASLNGLLIKPDEEFRLVASLGDINSQGGYLPELVIKGTKTVPEYGGGLCQIATTLFRTILASGLPVTARSPHTYRVSYYEPAGTDATIYDPLPDVRFINDTNNYILIQTKMQGNLLTFEFWGTSDGRKVRFEGQNKTDDLSKLKPIIFNITSPGPTKFIETEELKPGEKKMMEHAHNGADAVFYQYITMPDEIESKETWSSHYSPWQEVILIGANKEAEAVQPEPEPPITQ